MTSHCVEPGAFAHLPVYAGDPILALNEYFAEDARADRVNLSIGVFLDDAGQVPVMRAVQTFLDDAWRADAPCPYLPMAGRPDYRTQVARLVFGEAHPAVREQRIAVTHSLGGSGALSVGARLLREHFPQARVWISDPSWDNHRAIFAAAGFDVQSYPYLSPTRELAFDALLAHLRTLPARDVVVLHACCHNPTGVDLTPMQWDQVIALLRERDLIGFFDMAYQGMGDDVQADAYAPRRMAESGGTMLVANSFSKNFSLYGERCGGLSVVCDTAREAGLVFGELQRIIRTLYSSPAAHGARIVAGVLADAGLEPAWRDELAGMRGHLHAMRAQLKAALQLREPREDWQYLTRQKGMFAFTGFDPEQVSALRHRHGVYLVGNGRLCVAGLRADNLERVADAMAAVAVRH